MDLKKLTTQFKESEIEWRIGQCGSKQDGAVWATCLAYVSARAIMNRLDEVCGPENWKVEYSFPTNGGVICKLSVFVGDTWITKEDGAEQTDIEAFKGGISSALKRAGAVWGIGRYLYNLESGFAEIVNKGVEGARWAQTKDRKEFYWVPPLLPDWALPEGERSKKQPAAQTSLTSISASESKPCPGCHKPMMLSKWTNKVTGAIDWYCSKCKKSVPRETIMNNPEPNEEDVPF